MKLLFWHIFMICIISTAFLTNLAHAGYDNGVTAWSNEDYPSAVYEFKKSSNDAKSQFMLGIMYSEGKGFEKSDKEAFKWYLKSAQQGYHKAQFNLGNEYNEGVGVKQNYKEAAKWYLKAAKQGSERAQCSIGRAYYYGDGVKKDLNRAFYWYEKSAEQGYMRAQSDLGEMYYRGLGCEKDIEEALDWFEKASEQGDIYAKRFLFVIYYEGKGDTEVNVEGATKVCKELAEGGDAVYQYYMGLFYANGVGVSKDPVEALEWMNKAVVQKLPQAVAYMKDLNERVAKKLKEDADKATE